MQQPPSDASTEATELEEQLDALRSSLVSKPPHEVSREVGGLVEAVAAHSEPSGETVRFEIGVSFTTNNTLLDYRLDRLVTSDDDGDDTLTRETIKSPINDDHVYITFSYPADPHFDAAAFRGALLSTIDRDLAESTPSTQGTATDRSSNILDWLIDLFR
ncbi:MAG: hypothetical protein ABEH65_04590 [Halobacteriales archaeon]